MVKEKKKKFKMHYRGWKSIYYSPKIAAFKGSTPINLSDRLHQVLRWALGSAEIFMSRHCLLWYGYGGKLKWLERLAYINTVVYPFTSIPLGPQQFFRKQGLSFAKGLFLEMRINVKGLSRAALYDLKKKKEEQLSMAVAGRIADVVLI